MGENLICTICRIVISSDNSGVLVGSKGVNGLLSACLARNERELYNFIKKRKDEDPQFKFPVHIACRKRFTDLRNIPRDEKESLPPPTKKTRSSMESFVWEHCFFLWEDV